MALIAASTQAPSTLWFFARAGGFVSLLLVTATVALGIALTLRWRTRHWPTFLSEGLHRYLGTLFFIFLSIHVVTILLDPFTRFSLVDILVPFASSYRTVWMGLGICAAELGLALGLSVYARRVIGYRAWRVLHYGTQAVFPLAMLHGVGTGSDTRTLWAAAVYVACGTVIAGLVAARVLSGPEPAVKSAPAGERMEPPSRRTIVRSGFPGRYG